MNEDECSPKIAKNINHLNMSKLSSLFQDIDTICNYQLQIDIGCIISSSFDNELEIFDEIIELSSTGKNSVCVAKYRGTPLCIVKISEYTDEISREAAIGISSLNKIREYTPAFSFTYFSDSCSKMNYDWCLNSKSSFVLTEYVANSVSLRSLLISEALNFEQFLKIFFQVFSALNLADSYYGFTHWDLHTENILIQSLTENLSVPIYFKNDTRYLITNQLARIIDYGLSRTKKIKNDYYYPVVDFTVFFVNCYNDLAKSKSDSPETQKIKNFIIAMYESLLERNFFVDLELYLNKNDYQIFNSTKREWEENSNEFRILDADAYIAYNLERDKDKITKENYEGYLSKLERLEKKYKKIITPITRLRELIDRISGMVKIIESLKEKQWRKLDILRRNTRSFFLDGRMFHYNDHYSKINYEYFFDCISNLDIAEIDEILLISEPQDIKSSIFNDNQSKTREYYFDFLFS